VIIFFSYIGPFQIVRDSKLLEDILSGNPLLRRKVFNFLYEHHIRFVFKLMSKYPILEQEECLDAYGEAILAFKRQVLEGKFRGKSKISTYLFRIFKNKCIDAIRKKTSKIEKEPMIIGGEESGLYGIADDEPEDKLEQQEEIEARNQQLQQKRQLLEQAMEGISEKCRKILLAKYQGQPYVEIAQQFQLKNSQSVRQTVHKCGKKLKEIIRMLLAEVSKREGQ